MTPLDFAFRLLVGWLLGSVIFWLFTPLGLVGLLLVLLVLWLL